MRKWGGEDIFNSTIRNESLHQDSNGNGVRTVNVSTSINLVVKSKILLHGTFITTPRPRLMG